MRIEKTETL
jgi:hypothetical protein